MAEVKVGLQVEQTADWSVAEKVDCSAGQMAQKKEQNWVQDWECIAKSSLVLCQCYFRRPQPQEYCRQLIEIVHDRCNHFL